MSHLQRGILLLAGLIGLVVVLPVAACGGLFCQNTPVDQQAERIIFTVNPDETLTAYVQINYVGSAPDFAWVVPVPSVPVVDVAEIASFDELSLLTSPVFIPPLTPDCFVPPPPSVIPASGPMDDGSVGGVEVLASGTAGPYAYDVITSADAKDMIIWLRTNNYRITEQMEPLIKTYTIESMVFLAMKLRPEQGVQNIQPIVMTYEGTEPMIPLRLTAIAATPNMNIISWVFGDTQAVSTNYAHPSINDANIRYSFNSIDGTNYLSLVDQTVDLYSGRAFITEYAEPTSILKDGTVDPLVQKLFTDYAYVTRVFARISPEEMITDPEFVMSVDAPDISNVRDLSGQDAKVFWACEGTDQTINIEYDPNVVPQGFQ